MALITDLPAASSLSATDLLIKDTGSATQKITVANAAASATSPGLVTTGNQDFSGIKTFNANAASINASGIYPGLQFKSQNLPNTDHIGAFRFNFGAANPTQGVAYVEERSFNSDGTPTSYFENYYLPKPTNGLTASASYDILTTKTHEIVSVFRKTVASGATTTLTFSGASSGFMMTANSQAGGRGAYVLFASSSTVYAPTALGDNSGVTFSVNGRVITVTNGTSASLGISVIVFSGSIT